MFPSKTSYFIVYFVYSTRWCYTHNEEEKEETVSILINGPRKKGAKTDSITIGHAQHVTTGTRKKERKKTRNGRIGNTVSWALKSLQITFGQPRINAGLVFREGCLQFIVISLVSCAHQRKYLTSLPMWPCVCSSSVPRCNVSRVPVLSFRERTRKLIKLVSTSRKLAGRLKPSL